MTERGKIRDRDSATQVRDFTGLQFGTITPTDINSFADFLNKIFIFIEAKYGEAELPYGQQLAFERLCDACQKGGLETYFFIAEHHEVTTNDIDFANCIIRKFRYKGEWRSPKKETTVRYAIEQILKKNNMGHYVKTR